uniref:(California timema) hypothetical protein n=2 Tax=Timema TaxID=61471 RepID=A0A7R9J542_TIMCA|nr:unnamed protein product [Timema californicum]
MGMQIKSATLDIFDKVKADIRLMKEEQTGIERYKLPKERSLEQYASSMEAMKTTKDGLESELHQELMSQLSVSDQLEVDKLNDDIRRLTQENKEAFSLRMRLEAEKNKLENLLTNNLMRRKDELVQALQEISVEDRKRQLENCKSELIAIEKRIDEVNKEFKNMEKKVQEATKMQERVKYMAAWIHRIWILVSKFPPMKLGSNRRVFAVNLVSMFKTEMIPELCLVTP